MPGLVPIGDFDGAADGTTGFLIRTNGTESQDAVIGLIGPVAAGIIANDETVLQAAIDAMEDAVQELNAVQAYQGLSVPYTGLGSVPMQWVHKSLDAPVGELVTETVEGTYEGASVFRGDFPTLTSTGQLRSAQMPDWVASKDDIPDVPDVPDVQPRSVSIDLPIFGARVADARTKSAPVAVVFAGSSTLAASPGVVGRVTPLLQSCYPAGSQSAAQWSQSAEFTEITAAGLHVYSTGEGGTNSSDYLTDAECDRLAELDPGLIVHMLPNDYNHQVDPTVFAANVTARLAYFDSVLTRPAQHVLVHPYQRQNWTPPTYTWDEYEDALRGVAETRPDTVFFNLNPSYAANGVPGADPLGLISSDNLHQTAQGYLFMASLFASLFIA